VLGTGGSNSSPPKHATTQRHTHRAKTGAAQTTSTPATTTPAPATSPPATTDPVALNNQGKSLIDSGRPQDAIPVLQKALAAFPPDQRSSIDYAYTLFNLGDAYLRSGQPAKAIPYLQQRLKWNDQRDTVEAELRQAMQQAGQLPGAHGKGKHKGHGKGD
jgi:eukaryotic-like serine/threonine-protein kinase